MFKKSQTDKQPLYAVRILSYSYDTTGRRETNRQREAPFRVRAQDAEEAARELWRSGKKKKAVVVVVLVILVVII